MGMSAGRIRWATLASGSRKRQITRFRPEMSLYGRPKIPITSAYAGSVRHGTSLRLRRPGAEPSKGLLALRFEFAMPDRGRHRIELIDYSGELITRTSAQLASDLRAYMQVCDGMLLLGEAHRDNRSLAPLASDLENLKEAISILFAERHDRPQQDWPIASSYKWDRQGQIDFESPEHEDSRLQTFLENLDVPHSADPDGYECGEAGEHQAVPRQRLR